MLQKLIVVAMVMLFVANWAFAQATQPQPQSNPEDAKKLQESLILLRQALGIEQPATTGQVAQPPQQKSMADVMDKLLDMLKNTVASLSEAMKKVAPEVWRIMVRQQYAKAIGNLAVPWGLFLITLIYTIITKRAWKMPDEKNWTPFDDKFTDRDLRAFVTSFVPFMFGLIFSIWGAINLKDSILYLVNPEYYALRDLFMLLLNPSGM